MGFSYHFCNRKLCLCLLISFAYTFNIPLKFRNPYSFCRTINLEIKQSVADSEILEYEDTELLVKLYNKKNTYENSLYQEHIHYMLLAGHICKKQGVEHKVTQIGL